jgi:hypothetical protein
MWCRVFLLLAVGAGVLGAQETKPQEPPPKKGELQKERPKPATGSKEEVPPEEDVELAPEEYSFNPLQAEKDVQVGNFYFKQGKYRSAVSLMYG